jgi:hypothetical protein
MATKKARKTVRKATPKATPKKNIEKVMSMDEAGEMAMPVTRQGVPFFVKLAVLVLVGISVFWLVRKYRGEVVAAMVNKTPISRFELNQTLARRYGAEVLDEMIDAKLMQQIAQRENVTVSADDIKKERDSLRDRLGNEDSLKTALAQYGLTEDDLARQIQLKLYQQKLSEKMFKVDVSDDEVKTFFDGNKTLYQNKKLADVKDEIKQSLVTQKQQQQFSTWFDGEKKKAQIQKFI